MTRSAANSIPAAFWMLVHVINDPFLLRRARHEMEKCIVPSTTIGRDSTFDVTALCNNPLLQSIYAETLRLRAFPFLIRSPEREDLSFKEWLLPKSKFILISSYHAQMDENVWNTGSAKDCHPLAEFWADRFLIYPGNGASGPLKPSFRPQPAPRPDQADVTQETTSKQEEQGKEPIFTTEGLAGAWVPFGGGHRMCPGRHFAKVEIIATFAMMCTMFDIELIGGLPAPNMKEVGWGTLPTSGKTPCRIRRRC